MNVTKGSPTPEELAALVVALRAATAAPQAPEPVTRRPRRPLRRPLLPGPGGWRESRWNHGGVL